MREWLAGRLGETAVPHHFAAVSTNHAAMDAFGVGPDARFAMWDWVGGRYSLWSAVGLALELAIGSAHFDAMLSGAQAMDAHFRSSRFADNLPVLLGLIATGTATCRAARVTRSCRTRNGSRGCPRTCSNSRWRASASA